MVEMLPVIGILHAISSENYSVSPSLMQPVWQVIDSKLEFANTDMKLIVNAS
jgi:hypothetical protein